MASPIGKSGSQTDIEDLQRNYQKRREEIIDQNERQLSNLREDYTEKQEELRQDGRAAVNHIRKQTDKSIESTREQGNERITYERDLTKKQLETQKQDIEMRKQALAKEQQHVENSYSDRIANAAKEKENVIQNQIQQSRDFQKQQNEIRNKFEKEASGELNNLQSRTQKERKEILNANQTETRSEIEKHREEMKKITTENQKQSLTQKQEAQRALLREADETQKKVTQERQSQTKLVEDLRNKVANEYIKQRTEGDAKLTAQKDDNRFTLKREVEVGTAKQEEVREKYDNEIKVVHQRGEKEIEQQKQTQRMKVEKVKSGNEQELTVLTAEQEKTKKERMELYKSKLEEQDRIFKGMLDSQRSEFQHSFVANETLNRQALENQENRLAQAFVRQKAEMVEKFDKYGSAKDDPFYRLKEFSNSMEETPNFYIFKTKVPDHELETVDVVVHNDHIVVTAQRGFDDKVKKEDHEISMASNQSFRESIPLKYPVVPKGVIKEHKDGYLEVTIPKLILSGKV